MSRCFPFPPPGYTRNTRVEDLDLLKKEKHKEKHKKDKEKKDSKEKREKDRSDGKHKEKKDKEKHRDKKKEKDRDKVKHKSGSITPDEKMNMGLSGTHNLVHSDKSKDRESDRGVNLAEKRFCNGEQVSKVYNNLAFENKNNSPSIETKSFRTASESGQHKERTVNQLPHKYVSTEIKETEIAKLGRTVARPQVDGKEKRKENVCFGRMSVHGVVEAAKPSGSASVPSSFGTVQNRVGVSRDTEKKVGHILEDKEKIRDKEVCGREKPVHKDKSTEKEKKSDEKGKVTCVEQKGIEQSKVLDNRENHLLKSNVKDRYVKETLSAPNGGGLQNAPRDGNRADVAAPLHPNLGKRKDAGFNGSYDEHSSRPNKLARTTTPTLPQTENGRTLEPCQSSAFFVDGSKQRSPLNVKMEQTVPPYDTQKPSMNLIKVDGKECKLNGTNAQSVSRHPSQTTANTERKPHPDSKYLGQVLSVPKIDDCLEIDDQEWLFDSSSSQTRKPEVDSCEIDPTPQVWDKALWLEASDVYVLPYVIPR